VNNYVSVDRFEKETEIFWHVWLNVGLDSEVPQTGDWMVRDIEAAKACTFLWTPGIGDLFLTLEHRRIAKHQIISRKAEVEDPWRVVAKHLVNCAVEQSRRSS
jgi:hypothetical protein